MTKIRFIPAGTEGANYQWQTTDAQWTSGNANYPTIKASAAFNTAMGLEIPGNALDYVGYVNHTSATKVHAFMYFKLGSVPADLQVGPQFRYDATNVAARMHITSSFVPRIIGAGAATLWTGTGTLSSGVWYRFHLWADVTAGATNASVRLAGYLGDSDTPVSGWDSGVLTGQNLGGTVLYSTRLGKLNTVTISGASNFGPMGIDTDTDASSTFTPYMPTAGGTTYPMSLLDNAGGWTVNGSGVYTPYQALSDASDSTYMMNPDSTTNEAMTVRLQPLAAGSTIAGPVRMALDTGSGSTDMKLEVLQNTTVVATRTVTVASTTASDFTVTLTSGEVSAITDRNALRMRITAKAT